LIDTHCHLLPRLDDGPRTEEESLALARELSAQGVTRVLCTPHFSGMFPTVHAEAVERLRSLQPLLEAAGIRLETSLAAEIGPAAAVSEPLDELLERSVERRFAIIEVLADSPPASLAAIAERLGAAGLRTVFAHPERNRAVQRKPGLLDPLRSDGALVQIVAPSLVGRWGPETDAAAWRLIDTGRADLLASDAHGAFRRRPHLRRACARIAERLGEDFVYELTESRPRLLLDRPGPE
jgi:protein-tyrosine phosphatase